MRDNIVVFQVHVEFAYDGRVRAPQNAHDLAFGAAVGIGTAYTYDDAVAVHRLPGFLGRDENIPAHAFERMVGSNEAIAIAVHVQPSGWRTPGCGS